MATPVEHLAPSSDKTNKKQWTTPLLDSIPMHAALGSSQGDEAQLIDDEKLKAGQKLLEAQQMLLVAGFDQFADQGGVGGKTHAVALLAGGQTFATTVTGDTTLNAGVSRSASVVTITAAGVYTAPTPVSTVTITATSKTDTSKNAPGAVSVGARFVLLARGAGCERFCNILQKLSGLTPCGIALCSTVK